MIFVNQCQLLNLLEEVLLTSTIKRYSIFSMILKSLVVNSQRFSAFLLQISLLALAFLSFHSPLWAAIALPELSGSASNILTVKEQRQLGSSLYRQFVRGGALLNDPYVNHYIRRLGLRLQIGEARYHSPIHFFVVDDISVNAFAVLGGYIGINSGLILAAESESELASVVAHELSHLSQNHLLRGAEKSSEMSLPLTAALLAAILLGGNNPEVAEAAIFSAIAGSQQQQLNFSRQHEREADRIGFNLLIDAGFNPLGMEHFFQRLRQQGRYYTIAPEFLSTHPVTNDRIADAVGRSAQIDITTLELSLDSEDDFQEIRARVAGLITPASQLGIFKKSEDYLQRYSLMLAYLQDKRPLLAESLLVALEKLRPESPQLISARVDLEQLKGDVESALRVIERGLQLYPQHLPLLRQKAEILFNHGQLDVAKATINHYLRLETDDISAYQLLAQIEATSGNRAAAHLAHAEAWIRLQDHPRALQELKLGQKAGSSELYTNSRIDARIDELEHETSPLRKETADSPRGKNKKDRMVSIDAK